MIISALDRKLLRDLWHIRSQALAICLVIGCRDCHLRHVAQRAPVAP